MALTSTCGPHCAIRANAEDTVIREGHCNCTQCHAGWPSRYDVWFRGREGQTVPLPAGIDGQPLTGTPMCERWYERAGGYRPWHRGMHLVIRDDYAPELGPE